MTILPGGQSELPAEKEIVFGLAGIGVAHARPDLIQGVGVDTVAFWESGEIARLDPHKMYTFQEVTLLYIADVNTIVSVEASGDSGVTWTTKSVTFLAAAEPTHRTVYINVTGPAMRFRLEHTNSNPIHFLSWQPVFVERGLSRYAR